MIVEVMKSRMVRQERISFPQDRFPLSLLVIDSSQRKYTLMSRLIALLIVLLIPAMPAYAATRAAVFEIELQDTSGEQSTPAQANRILTTTEALRRELAETGKYEIVDLSADSERISKLGFQRSCVTCFVDIARDRGAEVAVFSTVNKVSTLILSMEIKVLSVATGKEMVRGTADIRGDNDRAWLRGMEWLVQHRIVPKESGIDAPK
jgi:hypothetical protein